MPWASRYSNSTSETSSRRYSSNKDFRSLKYPHWNDLESIKWANIFTYPRPMEGNPRNYASIILTFYIIFHPDDTQGWEIWGLSSYCRSPASMRIEIPHVLCLTFPALCLHGQDLNNAETSINVKALPSLVEIDRFEGIDHRSHP